MSTTYEQYCPVARALEIVGERWTLLIARELLLGPRRFTDLMTGLPGISANVLASRLRYELTDDALGLAGVVAAMAEWGMTLLGRPRRDDEVRGSWMLLGLAVTGAAPDDLDGTFELHIGDEVLHVEVREGRLHPRQGPAVDPAAVITATAATFAELALGRLDPEAALSKRRLTLAGDELAARRLLESVSRRSGGGEAGGAN
jgi:DNA-binding HxlR family transcriptional regulator